MTESAWPSWLDWVPDGLNVWDAWVAIGTILLAVATTWLARRTRQDVQTASRSVQVSERALAASIRPVLAEIPLGLFRTTSTVGAVTITDEPGEIDVWHEAGTREVEVSVPFRNVGQGLALLGGPAIEVELGQSSWEGLAIQTAVPSGEFTRLMFKLVWADTAAAALAYDALMEADTTVFEIDVPYTDMDGGQPMRTRATVERKTVDDEQQWQVERIELYAGDSDAPFASVAGRKYVEIARGA